MSKEKTFDRGVVTGRAYEIAQFRQEILKVIGSFEMEEVGEFNFDAHHEDLVEYERGKHNERANIAQEINSRVKELRKEYDL